MSGINPKIVYGISRIHCTFINELNNNNKPVIKGTGFWVLIESRTTPIFVTNRHNIDATIWESNSRNFKLESIKLELRKRGTNDELLDQTEFFELIDFANGLRIHPSADCALITDAKGKIPTEYKNISYMDVSMLADSRYLTTSAQIMDLVSFIGFPEKTTKWWDTQANLPIARLGALASDPGRPFTNKAIRTTDVGLVSGLSFSGSSGSPLFLHQKGIRVGGGLKGGGYIPPHIDWNHERSPAGKRTRRRITPLYGAFIFHALHEYP